MHVKQEIEASSWCTAVQYPQISLKYRDSSHQMWLSRRCANQVSGLRGALQPASCYRKICLYKIYTLQIMIVPALMSCSIEAKIRGTSHFSLPRASVSKFVSSPIWICNRCLQSNGFQSSIHNHISKAPSSYRRKTLLNTCAAHTCPILYNQSFGISKDGGHLLLNQLHNIPAVELDVKGWLLFLGLQVWLNALLPQFDSLFQVAAKDVLMPAP